MIGMDGKRESGNSIQSAWLDDDNDDIYTYICKNENKSECMYIYIQIWKKHKVFRGYEKKTRYSEDEFIFFILFISPQISN